MPRVATTLVNGEAVPERCDVMHFCLPTRRLLKRTASIRTGNRSSLLKPRPSN